MKEEKVRSYKETLHEGQQPRVDERLAVEVVCCARRQRHDLSMTLARLDELRKRTENWGGRGRVDGTGGRRECGQ